ncbi:hypothetical protein F4677DRAFT_443642 [Hypoxylon crocopeplum]|nr:hypothetical protein F4677DRAFT_443642 [Hypoxylon crocopeplum]
MADQRATKVKKEAKKIATDRRARKEMYRLLKRQVFRKYKPEGICDAESLDEAVSDNGGSIWSLPAHTKGGPSLQGATLGTMLDIAKHCYKLATIEFDKMDLYDHVRKQILLSLFDFTIQYILRAMNQDLSEAELSKSFVDNHYLVSVAQHQQQLAKENFIACVAKIATISNLPDASVDSFKLCKNCGDRFKPHEDPCDCKKADRTCFHGPCVYHPGNLRSWNGDIIEDGAPVNKQSRMMGKITLQEFRMWIGTFYWDCCQGKLVKPEVRKRSQKHKRDPLKPWEIIHPMDESMGCKTLPHHIPLQDVCDEQDRVRSEEEE